MTDEEELQVLFNNIKNAINSYNKRAKELKNYSNIVYSLKTEPPHTMEKGWFIDALRDADKEARLNPGIEEKVRSNPSGFIKR